MLLQKNASKVQGHFNVSPYVFPTSRAGVYWHIIKAWAITDEEAKSSIIKPVTSKETTVVQDFIVRESSPQISICFFMFPLAQVVGSILWKMALETVRRSTFFTSKLLLTAAAAFSVAPKLLRAEFCSDGKCSDEVEKAKLASDAAEKYRPEDSIFSKIIRKEIPADIIHEDEKVSWVILCLQSSFSFFSLFLGNRAIPQFFSSQLVLEAGWGYDVSIGKCCGCLWRRKNGFSLLYWTTTTFRRLRA